MKYSIADGSEYTAADLLLVERNVNGAIGTAYAVHRRSDLALLDVIAHPLAGVEIVEVLPL